MKFYKSLVFSLAAVLVVAGFSLPRVQAAGTHTLTIQYADRDGGSVEINPLGQSCGSSCTKSVADGTTVKLTIVSAAGYLTYGFSNAVSNAVECDEGGYSAICTFVMDKDYVAKPLWIYSSVNIVVSKKGTGSGTVTGPGINCGSDCSGSYSTKIPPGPTADPVALTAKPAAGSKFIGWDTSGDICYSGGGKGGSATINTSPTATCYIGGYQKTYKAVPIFNSTSSSSSSSDSTSSDSSASGSASSTTDATAEAPKTEAEATESLSALKINGESFDPAKSEKKEFPAETPIIMSGKTIPGGIITLYVFSEPKKYTTTADKDGDWQVQVEGLPAGDHHAEIEVNDPKTKQTSKRSMLLEFAVINAAAPASSTLDANAVLSGTPKSPSLGMVIVATAAGVAVLAGASLAVIARFKPELFARLKSKFNKPPSTPVEG